MDITYETIEQAARELTVQQKASLALSLLKDLDEGENEDVEALWAAEAEQRVDAYLNGDLEAIDGDEAMARLLKSLR